MFSFVLISSSCFDVFFGLEKDKDWGGFAHASHPLATLFGKSMRDSPSVQEN